MKLEGSLDAFSLPDIFQLLSYTKKTGGLRLQHAGAQGVVYFTDGSVTGASAEGGRQSLARRLIGLGLVEDAAVASAVDEAVAAGTPSGGGVVAALVSAGAVTADAVSRVAFEQLHDAVFELLRWPSGDFQLAVDQANPDDVGLRLVPDEVVSRASENKAKWTAAAALVPSPDAIPALVGTSAPESVIRAADWPVLRLVDGRRRVADIVDLVGAGQLATVVTLASLVERQLIEVRPADASDPVSDIVRRIALLRPTETEVGAGLENPPVEIDIDVHVEAEVAEPELASGRTVVTSTPAEPVPMADEVPAMRSAPVETVAAVARALESVPEAAAPEAAAPEAPALEAEPELPAEQVASTVVTVPETDFNDTVVVDRPARLGGAHTPGDVVPPRNEPFLAARQPEFAEPPVPGLRSAPTLSSSAPRSASGGAGAGMGNAAVAVAPDGLIERDPSVNRSLLLRLIAGVRGL